MVVESRWYGRFASCSCRPDVARSGVAGVLEGGVRQRVPFGTLWGCSGFRCVSHGCYTSCQLKMMHTMVMACDPSAREASTTVIKIRITLHTLRCRIQSLIRKSPIRHWLGKA